MLAGLEDISDGSIYIGGQRVNNVTPKDRDIAMVFSVIRAVSAYDSCR